MESDLTRMPINSSLVVIARTPSIARWLNKEVGVKAILAAPLSTPLPSADGSSAEHNTIVTMEQTLQHGRQCATTAVRLFDKLLVEGLPSEEGDR
jgi:hypothetical protein